MVDVKFEKGIIGHISQGDSDRADGSAAAAAEEGGHAAKAEEGYESGSDSEHAADADFRPIALGGGKTEGIHDICGDMPRLGEIDENRGRQEYADGINPEDMDAMRIRVPIAVRSRLAGYFAADSGADICDSAHGAYHSAIEAAEEESDAEPDERDSGRSGDRGEEDL